MSTEALDPRRLVDQENGWIDRRIFSDPEIHEREMERVFARCWLFLAHESQIPKTGDFVTAYMGNDHVIVARKKDGGVAAFINSCSHRGNRICAASQGNARQFVCNYHGWAFGLAGELIGMPQMELYEQTPGFDKDRMGLTPVAQIDSYKGLIFATFDPEAPSLEDYLGDYRWYLDIVLDNDPGGTEFLDGCIKYDVACNWKLPAENFAGDSYHAQWTHNSAAMAIFGRGIAPRKLENTFHANTDGHCWGFGLDMIGNAAASGHRIVVDYWRGREAEIAARLGKLRSKMVGASSSANLFPNFGFLPGHSCFRVWQPTGPASMELRNWILVNRNMPDEVKDAYRRAAAFTFSPGGVFEMDDSENWENATRANRGTVTRRQRLYYGLGQNTREDHPDLPGQVYRNFFSDANQMAFYRRWADLMAADSWADVPGGREEMAAE